MTEIPGVGACSKFTLISSVKMLLKCITSSLIQPLQLCCLDSATKQHSSSTQVLCFSLDVEYLMSERRDGPLRIALGVYEELIRLLSPLAG